MKTLFKRWLSGIARFVAREFADELQSRKVDLGSLAGDRIRIDVPDAVQ